MADLIKGRRGNDALRRGSVLEQGTEHRPMPRPKDDAVSRAIVIRGLSRRLRTWLRTRH